MSRQTHYSLEGAAAVSSDVTIRYADSPRVFGAIVVPQRAAMAARVGEDVFRAALEQVPRAMREEYEGVRADTWCSTDTAEEVTRTVARVAGVDAHTLTDASVHEAITGTVGFLWRALLRLTDDYALLRRAPMFYARSFDRGALSGERTGKGRAELLLEGWPHVPDLHGVAIAAGVRAVLELAGRAEVKVGWRREGEDARFDLGWRV